MSGISATLSLVMLVAFGGAEPLPGDSGEFALFVGQSVCLQCHRSSDSNGRGASVCTLEPIPLHDHSYEALQKPKAEHIAALSGVPDVPTQSRICLYCHATAADEGPRWTTDAFRMLDAMAATQRAAAVSGDTLEGMEDVYTFIQGLFDAGEDLKSD